MRRTVHEGVILSQACPETVQRSLGRLGRPEEPVVAWELLRGGIPGSQVYRLTLAADEVILMGMDVVELIMGIEEAFDIEIPDQEAEKLTTVGQLYAFVINELAFHQPAGCVSSAVFYRARRTLVERLGVPRRSIAPSTTMEALLPQSGRRAYWQSLSRAMELRLPSLELPPWMGLPMRGLGLTLLMIGLAAYFVYPISVAVLYSVGSALVLWAAHRAAAPFAVQIPTECATVGGTVRAALRLNHGMHPQTRRRWDPNDVWETLRKVIVEQLDVPPEVVTPDAALVDDLGAD